MLKEGQIIKLNNNTEYIVVKIINAHSFNYVYLITKEKPIEFLIGTEKMVNGSLEINEIKDNTELEYALTLLTN